MADRAVPEGYQVACPLLVVENATAAIDFYARAFGAAEKMRLVGPGDRVAHAEITIGDSVVMLADEAPEWGTRGPQTLDAAPSMVHLYVADVDAFAARAVAAGATVQIPISDQFYGDRTGRLRDPFGHLWIVATRHQDMAPEEMQRRFDAWLAEQAAG